LTYLPDLSKTGTGDVVTYIGSLDAFGETGSVKYNYYKKHTAILSQSWQETKP